MRYKIYLLLFGISCLWQNTFAYNEEKLDSIGNLNSIHSKREQHSTFHYDLVKLLAIKAGYPPDSAELIARYSLLVDQSNPQPGYPYPLDIAGTPQPDTFPTWTQSIAGTERTAPGINQFGENAGCYWHFALRNPTDTTTGAMVYGNDFPHPVGASYKGPPNFWRVPFSYYLDSIYTWAIYGTGRPGNPGGAPKDIFYFDETLNQYQLVPAGSIIALGILSHSIGDSYSHEECAVTDTIRSHPDNPALCSANYHHLEMPYDNSDYAYPHIDKSAQAIWRALIAYAKAKGYNYTPLWPDNNGNNIPDELEETNDPGHTATFIERWKAPETQDLNGDGVVNHFDHSARRIGLTQSEIATSINEAGDIPAPVLQVFPNPTMGLLNVIVYGRIAKATLALIDITGRKLVEKGISGTDNHLQFDMSPFASGIYFVQVGSAVQKVVYAPIF